MRFGAGELRCTQQQAAQRKQAVQAKSGVVWQLADAAGEAVRHADGLKLAMLPAKWKHRAAVLLGLLALEWAERWATGKRGEIAGMGFRLPNDVRQPENQKTA